MRGWRDVGGDQNDWRLKREKKADEGLFSLTRARTDKARVKRMSSWSPASSAVETNRTDKKEIEASIHEQPWQDLHVGSQTAASFSLTTIILLSA